MEDYWTNMGKVKTKYKRFKLGYLINEIKNPEISKYKVKKMKFDKTVVNFVKRLKASNLSTEYRPPSKSPDKYINMANRIRENSENMRKTVKI